MHRRVAKVDLAWAKNVTLPDLDHPDCNLWPPPQPSFATHAAMIVPAYDSRAYSADWAKAREQQISAIRAEQARHAAYLENLSKEQERGFNEQEKEWFRQSQQRWS